MFKKWLTKWLKDVKKFEAEWHTRKCLEMSYLSGVKMGIERPPGWKTLCEPCGNYIFPQAVRSKMNISKTVHGVCPRCRNSAFLISLLDWKYASGMSPSEKD